MTHLFAVPLLWDELAAGVLREAGRQGRLSRLERGMRLSLAVQTAFPRLGLRLASRLFREVRAQLLGESICFAITGGGAVREDTLRIVNALGYPLT